MTLRVIGGGRLKRGLFVRRRGRRRILGGDSDLVVSTPRHGSWASRLIPGAAFTLLAGTGHMLHHQHPEAVLNAVRAVAGHDPAQG